MGLITLTPGTMAVSLSPDRTRLIVHGMHASDTTAFRAALARLEAELLDAVRRRERGGTAPAEKQRRCVAWSRLWARCWPSRSWCSRIGRARCREIVGPIVWLRGPPVILKKK